MKPVVGLQRMNKAMGGSLAGTLHVEPLSHPDQPQAQDRRPRITQMGEIAWSL